MSKICSMIGLVVALSTGALSAQTTPPANLGGVRAGLGIDPLVITNGIESGKYEFIQYDRGKLETLKMNEIFQRSAADRDYFLSAIKDIESSIESLIDDVMKAEGGLVDLSVKSHLGGDAVPAATLQRAIMKFEAGKRVTYVQMKSLTAFTMGAVPSQLEIKAEDAQTATIPNYGNLNFDDIINYYNSVLEGLTDYANNLPMVVGYPNSAPDNIAKGENRTLTIKADKFYYTEKQLQDLQNEILRLRSPDANYLDKSKAFTLYVKQFIQDFLYTYGTSERWRMQDIANNDEARVEAGNTIERAFWLRDYIRATYKMPTGAIGMVYDKDVVNLDLLLTRTKNLFKFEGEVVWDEKGLMKYEQAYRNILKALSMRTTRITAAGAADKAKLDADFRAQGDESDLSERIVTQGDLGLIAKGRSILTWLSGQRPLADSGLMMVRLLAADLYGEKLVWEGRYEEMNDRYMKRYFSNDEDAAFYGKLEEEFDPQDPNDGSPFGGAAMANPSSVKGHFMGFRLALLKKEGDLNKSEEFEAQYMIAMNAVAGRSQKNRNSIRDLRKKQLEDRKKGEPK